VSCNIRPTIFFPTINEVVGGLTAAHQYKDDKRMRDQFGHGLSLRDSVQVKIIFFRLGALFSVNPCGSFHQAILADW